MNDTSTHRLIQFTDCHVSRNHADEFYGRNPVTTLKHIIAHINEYESGISAFLTTGDISHDGSQESYQFLAEQFTLLKSPVYSLPGNHDLAPSFQKTLSTCSSSTPQHVILGEWLIILLDSTKPGKEGGEIADGELLRMQDLLECHPDKHVLITMHHSPVAIASQWIDTMKIRNSERLFDILKSHSNVKAMICGHVHQAYAIQKNGIEIFGCPSTCHQFTPASNEYAIDTAAPGYRWLELSDTGRLSTGITRIKMSA